MQVLLTYGKHSKTLSAVRSLGRAGKQVIVTDDAKGALSFFSKYCHKSIVTASPLANPDAFLNEVCALVEEEAVDLLIPMDDPECDILSKAANSLKVKTTVALPSTDAYEVARNKDRTVRLAANLGIIVPKSRVVGNIQQLRDATDELGFPSVVKPLRSSGSRGFQIVSKREDIEGTSGLFDHYGSLVAQEFIPNAGALGVSYLLDHGKTLAQFAHKRLLEFPETGGASIVSESIRHPEAENAGRVILEHIGWHGIAMVEFRVNARTNKPVLMEINPRFWGTLPLAIACGVDFPRLLCELYERGHAGPVESYRVGVRCVNLLPRGVASAVAPGGVRRLLRTLRYASHCRCFYVESFDDPLPTFGAALELLRYSVDRNMFQSFYRRSQ